MGIINQLLSALVGQSDSTEGSEFIDENDAKGSSLESRVYNILRQNTSALGLWKDLVFTQDGSTHECDVVLLGKHGLYIFECKNFNGRIYGDYNQMWWKQYINGKRFDFYNPIMQNNKHCTAMQRLLNGLTIPMFSIIVFGNNADTSKVNIASDVPNVYICQQINLMTTLMIIQNVHDETLDRSDLSLIRQILDISAKSSVKLKEEHVEKLKKKYNSYICPQCGGCLVERIGRGRPFLGCDNYPRCRYTRPLNKKYNSSDGKQ